MNPRVLLFVALVLSTGCSMTPEGDPLLPQHYTPETKPESSTRTSPKAGPALRLGWVRSAEHLGARMAWRKGATYGFYERRRWTESPVAYLERALRQRLFLDKDGPRRALTEKHPTLRTTLLAFDAILDETDEANPHKARVTLSYVISKGEEHLAEGVLTWDEPMFSATAAAASEATQPQDSETSPSDEAAPKDRAAPSAADFTSEELAALIATAMGRALRHTVDELAAQATDHLR